MKKSNRRFSAVFILLMIVCIGVLCYSLYQALRIYIPQQHEQDRYAQLRELIADDGDASEGEEPATDADGAPVKKRSNRYQKLFELNEDFSGWLKVEDTVIDYPVMKSDEDDPEYYLHRDFDRNYSFSGCLFIGENCDADSDVFIVYGHNMNNGSMFGGLDSYRDPDWASAHRDISFDTMDGHRTYRVFAAFPSQVYPEASGVFKYYQAVGDYDRADYDEILEHFQGMSVIDIGTAPEYPAQILLLSTCSYHTDDGRFVVAAYRVD